MAKKKSNGSLFLWAGGFVGLGLLAAGSTSRGRQVLKDAGESMADAVNETVEEGFDWIQKIVARTSEHEGGYDSLNLNRDGAGLSFGILQWSQRTGALGKLLRELQLANPDKFARLFGPSWQSLLQVTEQGSLGPVGGVVLWQEPWISRFKQAGADPEFQSVQDRLAADGIYMRAAIESARILGIPSERAVSVAYDTAVQQGPNAAKSTAEKVRASLAGQTLPARSVLQRFVAQAAARFRRTTPPSSSRYNKHLVWKPVGSEWHVFAKSIDLYTDITRRRTALINDSKLSDAPIRLA